MNDLNIDIKKNYTYFISEPLLEELNKSSKIEVYGHQVNIKFLKLILEDETCFYYAKKYFDDEIRKFRVSAIKDGNIIGSIWHPKGLIIKGIEKLIESGNLKLSNVEEKRLKELKEIIKFDKFLASNKDNNYNIEIEKINYNIPVEDIINFFNLSESEYNKICLDENIKSIYGISKKHFIYAANRYITENRILTRYDMPWKMYDKYNDIRLGKKIDIYAINRILKTTDTKHNDVKISDELYKAVLDGMPSSFNPLEKAIYIYIKMCKILTYDEEYYASNQVGYSTLKHLNINYVSGITPDNSEAVCFEFNLIYSKFLSELKINFETFYSLLRADAYGSGHASLTFRFEDYIISADAILNILKSDLTYAKLNQPLRGLKCENKNKGTIDKFNKTLDKVYKSIIKQEGKKEDIHIHTYDELIKEYERNTNNIKKVEFEEKLSILLSKLNSLELKQIDYLSYTLQLRKILFNDDERDNNISTVIVSRSVGPSFNLKKQAYMIITINEDGFLVNQEKNKYYCLDNKGALMPITKEEIEEEFDNNKLKYIRESDISVPGFDNKGVSK